MTRAVTLGAQACRPTAPPGPSRFFTRPENRGAGEATPAAGATGRYCYRTPAACAELREHSLSAWRTIHGNDPEEIERRNKEATATLFKTMRSGSGITRW